jgi:P4 family phage/plasmid primase-like protien
MVVDSQFAEAGPQLVPLGELISYDEIGLKLIPIGKDGKTPSIGSTNDIYKNPNYWTPGRLQQEHWRFCNVATTFGEVGLKDENGASLYLHELDEDSAAVYRLLSPLHEQILANTFVTRTRKEFEIDGQKVHAIRFTWLSHTQHPSIPHHRSKPGFEFEIKSDNTCGHSTLPPSRHRDDPDFHYTASGQSTLAITDNLYDQVLDILSDYIIPHAESPKEEKVKRKSVARIIELTLTQIETIAGILKPLYAKGVRHHLCYAVGGILRKSYVLEVCASQVINLLAAEDEELDSRIINLEATYQKDPMDVTGRGYLKDILWRAVVNESGKEKKNQLDKEETEDVVEDLFNSILIAIGVAPGFLGMVVEAVMNQWRFVTLENTKEILYWNKGNYEPEGEVIIEQEMFKQFGYKLQLRHKREVLAYIRQQTYHKKEEFDTDLDIVNIGDGLYHISTDTITDHDPDYLTRIQNPKILHSLRAEPKYYRQCVKNIFYSADYQVAIDTQAYTFHRANPFELITILLGDGLNGKTAFMSPLRVAHGPKNMSTVRFKRLVDTEDRFSLAQLEGKCFNYDGEMSRGFIEDPSTIKLLTGNAELNLEEKNKTGRTARIFAKIFNSANTLPKSADQSGGYYRRNTVLCLPKIFEEGAEGTDPDMEAKLTTSEEISGIFFYDWMPSLRRILKEKRVTRNERTIEQLRDRYEMAVDPIKAFIEECIMDGSTLNQTIFKDELYQEYLSFCENKRLQVLPKKKFGHEFKRQHLGEEGDYRDVWRAVRLKRIYEVS